MKIIMATKNPGKIEGAKKAFSKYFRDIEIVGISVSSNVSDQPVNEEIYLGAKNRIKNLKQYCKENNIKGDLYISVESGITNQICDWMIVNVAVIEDNEDFVSYGTSPGFPVPNKYVEDIIKTELGTVMDEIFKKADLKSSIGGISILTHEIVSRLDLTEMAFVMALTKYINNEIWNDKEIKQLNLIR